jgi:hypothetical protein
MSQRCASQREPFGEARPGVQFGLGRAQGERGGSPTFPGVLWRACRRKKTNDWNNNPSGKERSGKRDGRPRGGVRAAQQPRTAALSLRTHLPDSSRDVEPLAAEFRLFADQPTIASRGSLLRIEVAAETVMGFPRK